MSKWKKCLLLVLASALSGCDERCSHANCKVLVNNCRLHLSAEPNFALCGIDATKLEEPHEFCPAACAVSNAGATLECVGDSQSQCRDNPQAVVQSCTRDLKPAEPSCLMKCATERATCEKNCAPFGKECLNCAARCGLALGRCEADCPRAGS